MCRVGKRCKNSLTAEKRNEHNARRRAKYQSLKAQQGNNGLPVPESTQGPQIGIQTPKATDTGLTVKDIDIQKLSAGLQSLNRGGDMYFHPDTMQVYDMAGTVRVKMKNIDGIPYEFHLSKSTSGAIVSFKSYDDEDEITEARPFLQVNYSEMQTEGEFRARDENETICLNMLDMVERMDDPSKNWNKDEQAAGFLYFGEAHGDINSALRHGTDINDDLVNTLDNIMTKDTLPRETVVYRGIRGKDNFISSIKDRTYRDAGYLSTTTDPEIAKGFSGGGRSSSAVLKLVLAAGTKCHDGSGDSEKEITLPRNYDISNGSWEFFD